MQPLLFRQHYFSPDIFEAERRTIFGKLWILAAIRPMVARHLEFRTLEIAGVPVLVQNFHGRIRAFENICRHRLSKIHVDEFGLRPLACPYHHWSYADDGTLTGVPSNSALFQYSPGEMHAIRLREFETRAVGSLIFVNLSASPIPLESQFSQPLLDLLSESTGCMDDEYIYTRYSCEFNWKTGMENIKDPLHVQCLHRDTFPGNIDIRASLRQGPPVNHARPASERRLVSLSEASTWGDAPISGEKCPDWHALVENLPSHGSYRAVHLFPNVNLMIVDGTSFALQIYNPTAPETPEMQVEPTADLTIK